MLFLYSTLFSLGRPKHGTFVLKSNLAPPIPVSKGSRLFPEIFVIGPPFGSRTEGE